MKNCVEKMFSDKTKTNNKNKCLMLFYKLTMY